MIELLNNTNWSAGIYSGWNAECEPQITCVIKRGYSFDTEGNVKPLDTPPTIIESDQFYLEPHNSSLKEVSDLSPYKLGSETYLYGTAYPEPNKMAMEVEYNLILNDGKRWSKKLRVTGKRTWKKILLGFVMSKPELLEATELQYENAFGGSNPENSNEIFVYNPVGKGFNKASGWKVMNLELPNIEIGPKFLQSPPQQQQPAGFSPLPEFWEPRKKYLGQIHAFPEEQAGCPYPSNSHKAIHNVAPLDQRFALPFVGGEKVILKGFFDHNKSKRLIEFNVPKINFDVSFLLETNKKRLFPVFDTLIINTDEYEFHTISRLALPWDILDTRTAWLTISDKIDPEYLPNIEQLESSG